MALALAVAAATCAASVAEPGGGHQCRRRFNSFRFVSAFNKPLGIQYYLILDVCEASVQSRANRELQLAEFEFESNGTVQYGRLLCASLM